MDDFKYINDYCIRKQNSDFVKNNSVIIPDKALILEHMKSGTLYGYTTAKVIDIVKSVEISEMFDFLYTDGEYSWSATEIYHLEHYDIPISDEFIEHVKSCSKRSKL
ncbi:MAG: hypothetical protein Q4C42_05160 [Clostridia bacterium]|nr:hypothetical protein [Clostridia bacterium]